MIKDIHITKHEPVLAQKMATGKLKWYVKGWKLEGTYLYESDTCNCMAKPFDALVAYEFLEMDKNKAYQLIKDFLCKTELK